MPKRNSSSRPSSAELAQELPFSEEPGTEPWDTPSERVDSIKKAVKRGIRKKAAGVAHRVQKQQLRNRVEENRSLTLQSQKQAAMR